MARYVIQSQDYYEKMRKYYCNSEIRKTREYRNKWFSWPRGLSVWGDFENNDLKLAVIPMDNEIEMDAKGDNDDY